MNCGDFMYVFIYILVMFRINKRMLNICLKYDGMNDLIEMSPIIENYIIFEFTIYYFFEKSCYVYVIIWTLLLVIILPATGRQKFDNVAAKATNKTEQ